MGLSKRFDTRVDIDEWVKCYTGRAWSGNHRYRLQSERSAVMLSRRVGGISIVALRREFVDPELDKLVGKRIRVRGVIHRHTLTMLEWEEVP